MPSEHVLVSAGEAWKYCQAVSAVLPALAGRHQGVRATWRDGYRGASDLAPRSLRERNHRARCADTGCRRPGTA